MCGCETGYLLKLQLRIKMGTGDVSEMLHTGSSATSIELRSKKRVCEFFKRGAREK